MGDLEFLKAVKMRIENVGHARGVLGPVEGPNCLLGSAAWVGHPHEFSWTNIFDAKFQGAKLESLRRVPAMRRIADLLGFDSVCDVYEFNDGLGLYEARGFELKHRVMARLDAAIERLEARERDAALV